jgi:hypothetical protein
VQEILSVLPPVENFDDTLSDDVQP